MVEKTKINFRISHKRRQRVKYGEDLNLVFVRIIVWGFF